MNIIDSDLQAIQNPLMWPRFPVLPMVERDDSNRGRAGIMIPHGATVYLVNMFSLKTGVIEDLVKDVPKVEYESFAELLKVWRPD